MATQDRAFTLLEGRQRPEQSRDLYLLAGITCGLMAYASHDMGATHDAMTQARTGYPWDRDRSGAGAHRAGCHQGPGRDAIELGGAIEGWTSGHLTHSR